MKNFFSNKKIVALGVTTALLAASVGGVYLADKKKVAKADKNVTDVASDAEEYSYDELLPAMEKLAKEYAVSYAKNVLKEDIECKTVTPIYDLQNNIKGYSVGVDKDNKSYGYVNIDYSKEQVVTEYSLQENTRSMYQALTEEFTQEVNNIDIKDCTNKLYNPEGIDYAVSALESDEEVIYYNEETYESDEFTKMLEDYSEHYLEYYDNIEYEDDFDFEDYDFYTNDENNKSQTNTRTNGMVKTSGDKDKIKDKIKQQKEKLDYYYQNAKDVIKGNFLKFFSKVAYKELEDFLESHNNSDDIFLTEDKLVGEDVSIGVIDCVHPYGFRRNIDTIHEAGRYRKDLLGLFDIVYQENLLLEDSLETSFKELCKIANLNKAKKTDTFGLPYGAILKEYCKQTNKKVNYIIDESPEFSIIKKHIDKKRSVLFNFAVKNKKDYEEHAVNVVGYNQMKVGNEVNDYIIVVNGWNHCVPRYVLYDDDRFAYSRSVAFVIKDKQ